MNTDENSWYKEGLRFECTGCGQCCTGAPGYVWVSLQEIEEMAKVLNITSQEFSRKYVRRIGQRLSLTEKKPSYDCVFLKERKCLVYQARPMQCRTFPFWPELIKSKEAWKEAAKTCEGIHDQASLIPPERIEEQKLLQIRRNSCTSSEK